jgi:hypothetical protein
MRGHTLTRLARGRSKLILLGIGAGLAWLSPAARADVTTWGVSGTAPGQLSQIVGGAAVPNGDVLVADADGISQFSRDGVYRGRQLPFPSLRGSRQLAVDPVTGTLYVGTNLDVEAIPAGSSTGVALPIPAPFNAVVGNNNVAVAPNGDVYVSALTAPWDGGDVRIFRFDRSLTLLGSFGSRGTGPGQFDFYASTRTLAVAPDGTLYVSDEGNLRIQHLTADGRYLGSIGRDFINDPGTLDSLAVDSNGDLFLAYPSGEHIVKLAPDGRHLGDYLSPDGLVGIFTSGGTVYTSDGHSRITRIDPEPNVTLAASSTTPRASDSITLDASGSSVPFSSVTRYDWDLDGNGSFETSTGADPHATAVFAGPGPLDVRVRATAADGFSAERTIDLAVADPTTPTLTASLATPVAGEQVTLTAASAGPDPHYAWDLDGDGVYETDTGTSPTATTSFAASGAHHPAVRVTWSGGASAVASIALDVRIAPPPGVVGISVDAGTRFTNDPDTTLSLVWPHGATAAIISNDGGFFGATQVALAPAVAWTLDSSGPERLPKTVYVRFLGAGIDTVTFQDDIILDETPPTLVAASATRLAAQSRYAVTLRGRDATSGVAGVRVSASKSPTAPLLAYRSRLVVKLSGKPRRLYAQAVDAAGNPSRWRTITVGRRA